ncbi:MAG: DUF4198 domain-containing protein [Acidobacteriota bacterium]
MKNKIFIFFIFTLIPFSLIFSHDFWLVLKSYNLPAGKNITVYCNTGDKFPESEAPISPDRIERCSLINSGEKIEIKEFRKTEKSLLFDILTNQEGTYLIELILKPLFIKLSAKDFNYYLEHKGLTEIIKLRKLKGLDDKEGKEEYSKYAKAIIQIGDKKSEIFKEILGHEIEIIPELNPYNLKSGDILPIKIFYDGKPLPSASISYGNSEELGKIYKTQTDSEGNAKIDLTSSGIWYIHTIHMIPSLKTPEIEWESFWATLTFEIL